MEQHIARSPYVERAMVYRRPSGEVRVDLWEEQPSFRLVTDTGNYYVSRKDRLMPVRAGVGVDVPLVSGQVDREAFPKVREVIARVEQDDFFRLRRSASGCPDVRRAGRRCTILRWIPGWDCKWCWARRTSWTSSSRISG